MSKFLFIVPPFTGHVNPTLGLGAGLLEKGHHVAWICLDPKMKECIPQGGVCFFPEINISQDEKKKLEKELTDLKGKSVYGLDSLKFLYEEVLVPMNRGIMNEIRKIIDTYHPNIIVNDHQMFAAAIAAVQKNIPYVTSITAPAAIKVNDALPGVYKWESDQIIAFQKEMGITEEIRLDCSRQLSLVYTSKYFFGDSDVPDYIQFIGPIIKRNEIGDSHANWKQFEKITDRKKILISIGTTFDHEQKKSFFTKVIEAFEKENITVIVVSDSSIFDYIPDNFFIYPKIPQLRLLPYMDAVVCHGGYNTVCESLSNGKPLIVLPIAYDQSYVAGCVVDRGCGIRMNFNRFKAQHLREAVNTVLNDDQYRQNTEIIQKSFDNAGGISKAIALLEELLKIKTNHNV